MLRFSLFLLFLGFFIWSPFMDQKNVIEKAGNAFGPFISPCFDEDHTPVFTGVSVRWYPFGRMVHTCHADFVVFFWGAVSELGGVYKARFEIDGEKKKTTSLTCDFVSGEYLKKNDTSFLLKERKKEEGNIEIKTHLFPDAQNFISLYRDALKSEKHFAHSFSVIEWECGIECKKFGIIDTITGDVIAHDISFEYGLSYSKESPLIVVNGKETMPSLFEDEKKMLEQIFSFSLVPRIYYALTFDSLSDSFYLVKICTEASTVGLVEITDSRIWGKEIL
jgi:hypothetical protein